MAALSNLILMLQLPCNIFLFFFLLSLLVRSEKLWVTFIPLVLATGQN